MLLAAFLSFSSHGEDIILNYNLLYGLCTGIKGCEVVVKVLRVSGTRWGPCGGGGHTGTGDGVNVALYPAVGLAFGGSADIGPTGIFVKDFCSTLSRV